MKVTAPREIAEDVWVLVLWRRLLDTNVYLVRSEASWALIDTGCPGNCQAIRRAAEVVFGPGIGPAAILLTHLYIDHSGSVKDLVAAWNAPVLEHPRELPLVGGYVPEFANPLDRRVALPLLNPLPRSRKRVLTDDSLPRVAQGLDLAAPPPGVRDWPCVSAPGHSPGSVAFFRPHDRLLLIGDALPTVNLASLRGLVRGRTELAAPLRFTDWNQTATEDTIGALAQLLPTALALGHGRPLAGPCLPHDLSAFADQLIGSREITRA